MQLSGEIADGNVLSVLSSPAYVRWARERIGRGRARGRAQRRRARLATFAFVSVGRDGARAKAALREPMAFYLAADGRNALTDAYGISDELEAMLEAGGADAVAREMPDRWLDDLAVAGEPDECAEKIRRLLDAGSDSVVLFPIAERALRGDGPRGRRRRAAEGGLSGRWTGRTALVTGSSRNLGAVIAERLAAAGATVAVTYRRLGGAAEAVVGGCGARPAATVGGRRRSRRRAGGAPLVEAAAEGLGGRIDVLVHNAGPFSMTPFGSSARTSGTRSGTST